MKRIIGLVLLLLAFAGIVNVVRNFSQGDTTRATGNSAYDKGQKAGKYAAPVVLVLLGWYGLLLVLQSEDTRPIPPPVRRSTTGTLPPPSHPSLRGGQDTFASNPALLRVSAGQWLAANPWVIIVSSSFAVIGLSVGFIKLPVGIVLMLAAGILLFREVREAKQKFYMGDVCPGVVISEQEKLVAVFTDLAAAGRVPLPAIKILKQPLQRMTTEAAHDGMRVAATALYHGDARQPAWQNFSPEVINCVVHDPDEIARVLASITEEEWQALDACLAQVPVGKPGLYRMWGAGFASPGQPEADLPHSVAVAPGKPWFKTTAALVGFSIVGGAVGLFILASVLRAAWRGSQHRGAGSPRVNAPPLPQTRPPGVPRPSELKQAGPYSVGGRVEANWTGRWIPGTITAINPGGFTLMIQLEDARFPRPIVLSTNQVRSK